MSNRSPQLESVRGFGPVDGEIMEGLSRTGFNSPRLHHENTRDTLCDTFDVLRISGYARIMIRTFGDPDTERLFERRFVKRLAHLAETALRRLVALDAAKSLSDLRIPPSNRLEALTGDRRGRHSLRINDQYRVCFRWKEGNAYDVEITKHYR